MSRRVTEHNPLSQTVLLTPAQRRHDLRVRKEIEKLDARPSRYQRWSLFAGWGSALFILGWMSFYEDFGPEENVFTDIRRNYRKFMKDTFNLTPRERKLLSLPKAPKDEARRNLDKDLEEMRKHAGILSPSTATADLRDDQKPI